MLIFGPGIINPDLQPKSEPRMPMIVVQPDWYTLHSYPEDWLLSWTPSALGRPSSEMPQSRNTSKSKVKVLNGHIKDPESCEGEWNPKQC